MVPAVEIPGQVAGASSCGTVRAAGNEPRPEGSRDSTNNRMELTAVVRGLEALKRPCRVVLYTDSVYVGKGLSEWMPKWKAQGWKRKEQGKLKPVKNEDLWRRLDRLISSHQLQYVRVVGHSGHPENERCDRMAVKACQRYQ